MKAVRKRCRWTGAALLAAALCAGPGASAGLLGFDEPGLFQHGTVVSDQYEGVVISARNIGDGPDLAVAFDSSRSDTRDPDLQFPNDDFGNILIIQENAVGCSSGVCSLPDDEGSRRAGYLEFDFRGPGDVGVPSFGFALLDVDSPTVEMGSVEFFIGDVAIGEIAFTDLGGVSFGDNVADTVAPIPASRFGEVAFDRVRIHLGGSGAVDDVRFGDLVPVPEPGTAALLALGLLALGSRRRPGA